MHRGTGLRQSVSVARYPREVTMLYAMDYTWRAWPKKVTRGIVRFACYEQHKSQEQILALVNGLESLLQCAHVGQEFAVRLGFTQLVDKQLHGFDGRQRIEYLAQDPDARQVLFRNEQLFLTSA
jgi:hypothetical protein